MSQEDLILSQSEYESLLEEVHRLQARISELTAIRDDLIYAGRPFSNQVIEICEMARNHIPEVRFFSLESITDRLGIDVEGDTPAEIRCRQIWKCYCRFDRSELERRQGTLQKNVRKGVLPEGNLRKERD